MPAHIPPCSKLWPPRAPQETARLRLPASVLAAVFGLGTVLAGGLASAQTPAPQPLSTADQKPAGDHAKTQSPRSSEIHRTRAHTPAQAAIAPPQPAPPPPPPAPKPPDWPANARPTPATVVWDAQGLQIKADNSSLDQILHQVAQDTGSKVEGLSQDQRVFGSFGPGDPRDVLSQLLDGSGYNVLMLGGQDNGAPDEIVLSIAKPAGPQPPAGNAGNASSDDDSQQQVEEPPEPLPEPRPARISPAFTPGQPNTPQQVWQQMRERQLEMERGQQGNMPPEQQPPPPPPNPQ